MRNALDVIGLPVILLDSGKQIGKVKDILFATDGSLQGLQVETAHFLRRRKYIPLKAISAIGRDAVTVSEPLMEDFVAADGMAMLQGQRKMKGMPILTTNGDHLGTIVDVYFQEELGTIIGYELTDGFLSDVTEGRKWLRPTRMIYGEDAYIVPNTDRKRLNDTLLKEE